ncbi:MAG: hypothetical protein WKG00_09200 [Polyangiaceae bacterium]
MRVTPSAMGVCLGALLWCGAALAQPSAPAQERDLPRSPDESTRNAARALAAEGDALLAGGDFSGAVDRFSRAWRLVPAPTIGVRWARALVAQDQLIAAEERYVATVRTPLGEDAPPPFHTAVQEATAELAALRPRIPRLTIVRAPGVGAVHLDGKDVPEPLLGVPRPVDPGAHEITAANASAVRFELDDGDRKRIELAPLVAGIDPDSAGGRRTAAWVAFGVGGAGLGVGLVAGAIALGKKGDLDDACGQDHGCPVANEGDLDGYRSAGVVSTVGFVVGGLGAATGALILLTLPGETGQRAGRARPSIGGWVGAGRAGLTGSF